MKKWIILLVIVSFISAIPVYGESVDLNLSGVPSSWARADLQKLADYGILDQWIFKTYQDSITRLDFIYLAVVLYESIKGEEIIVDSNISFVDSNNIYVLKGATVGITSGIGDNKFGPSVKLTREQLATMMVKALELTGRNLTASSFRFTDDHSISSYAKTSIYKAYNHKIINGYNNAVTPKGNASIEQALLIFKNIYDNFVLPPTTSENVKLTSEQIGLLSESVVKLYVESNDGTFSTGSGFFYEQGKIGTNYHVIDNAKRIEVEFDDGTLYQGIVKVLGYDKVLDIAAISIAESGTPPLKMGDSSKLIRGQNIYTIGSPVGLMNTLSNGLVGSIREQSIQITAPISPGSSGGVLLDEYGKVVGITSSGIIEGENLGFAIPINLFSSMSKNSNLTLTEFTTLTTYKPPSVTYVTATVLNSNEIFVLWQDNGADYYYLFNLVNDGEWYQIPNYLGGYDFSAADSKGTTITGYQSGDSVIFAVMAVKNEAVSDHTLSNSVLISNSISSAVDLESFLEYGYSSIQLNNYSFRMFDYSVMNFDTNKVSIYAYILRDDINLYFNSEQANLQKMANDLNIHALVFKDMLGKDVSITIVYSDLYSFYPSSFEKNYMYDSPITYSSTTGKWQIFYPLLNVDTVYNNFLTWFSIYSY